jgi:sn-glycerol 3-phosphate transport system substrate-binding protein
MKRKLFILIAISVAATTILSACAPQEVVKTVVVTEMVEGEVVEKVVTATPEPEDFVVLRYYYPVGVAGALAPKMMELVDTFNKEHPDIMVDAIFSGYYLDSFTKAVTAHLSGNPPDVLLCGDTSAWSLMEMDAIIPVDDYIEEAGGDEYWSDFFDAFQLDTLYEGMRISVPFQKSTPIFYYNKEAFEEVGLDPEDPPENWDELLEYAQKLVKKDASGEVTRWGVEIPIDAWMIQAFAMQNGSTYSGKDGTEIYLDDPVTVEAMQFMADLANVYEVAPQYRMYADASADFVAGETAMMYNSTGGLAFVRQSATFDFGVAFMPGKERRAGPTGGASLVIFNDIPQSHKDAAWEFVKWMTEPEQTAFWSVASGYLPVRKSTLELEEYKDYLAEVPQAMVGLEQLQFDFTVPATHNGRKVFEIVSKAMEEAMYAQGPVEDIMKAAQAEADEALADFK